MPLIDADLIAWERVEPSIRSIEDWELTRGLHLLGFDGLITLNHKMLSDPTVLAVILQTGFTVAACEGAVGGDPVRATGLVLLNLNLIMKNDRRDMPQVWYLRAALTSPVNFGNHVRKMEDRHGYRVTDFRLSASALEAPIFGP